MNKTPDTSSDQKRSAHDFNRLPVSKRASAAVCKYVEAVKLYASTDMPLRRIAEVCGVTAAGLSAHIGKYHRQLLFARYGLDINNPEYKSIKVKQSKGQSLKTYLKYKEAIEACGNIAYIEYNVSQVARMFNLNGTPLSSQLRVHYPDIIPARERLRQRLGIADNTPRGPRRTSVEVYTEAMRMYRDTDLTVGEVARRCDVSKGGLTEFMRFYHKDIISAKAKRRLLAGKAKGIARIGKLSGNGGVYGPKPETTALYAPALELYTTTSMTFEEIAEATGVPPEGFRFYVQHWHRGEALRRRGYEWDGSSEPDLKGTRHFLKSTSGKYEKAISSLRTSPRSVAEVATEFGLNADVFREYLKTHEPELAARQGMMRLADGRVVKRASSEKYQEAVRDYATTAEPLRSIAKRHGITYNSLYGYVTRNCAAERESHMEMVRKAAGAE